MPQTYQPSNIGWEFLDTPDPLRCGVAVTAEIRGLTAALLTACIGQPLTGVLEQAHLRQPVPNEFAGYIVTHYRRLIAGTLTFFAYPAITEAQARVPFNSVPEIEDGDFWPILKGGLLYEDPGAPYILMSSTSLDAGVERTRYGVKRVYHPSYNGPCTVVYNYYLSNAPFPEDMMDTSDAPVPNEVDVPIGHGLRLQFQKCLHDEFIFYQLDEGNLQEVYRFGDLKDAVVSLAQQKCEATNITTWQDQTTRFTVQRTDGDKGQYFAIERVVLAPELPPLAFQD